MCQRIRMYAQTKVDFFRLACTWPVLLVVDTKRTVSVKSFCGWNVSCIVHPEMSVVTRTETWLTGENYMISHHYTTVGGGGEQNRRRGWMFIKRGIDMVTLFLFTAGLAQATYKEWQMHRLSRVLKTMAQPPTQQCCGQTKQNKRPSASVLYIFQNVVLFQGIKISRTRTGWLAV